jgi:hypothetical protein
VNFSAQTKNQAELDLSFAAGGVYLVSKENLMSLQFFRRGYFLAILCAYILTILRSTFFVSAEVQKTGFNPKE